MKQVLMIFGLLILLLPGQALAQTAATGAASTDVRATPAPFNPIDVTSPFLAGYVMPASGLSEPTLHATWIIPSPNGLSVYAGFKGPDGSGPPALAVHDTPEGDSGFIVDAGTTTSRSDITGTKVVAWYRADPFSTFPLPLAVHVGDIVDVRISLDFPSQGLAVVFFQNVTTNQFSNLQPFPYAFADHWARCEVELPHNLLSSQAVVPVGTDMKFSNCDLGAWENANTRSFIAMGGSTPYYSLMAVTPAGKVGASWPDSHGGLEIVG